MSGAYYKKKVEDEEVLAKLRSLHAKTSNLSPILKNIGEALLRSTKQRFRDEKAPDGKRWQGHAASTKANYLRRKAIAGKVGTGFASAIASNKGNAPISILRASGRLIGSIHYKVTGDNLKIGSNVQYAAIHQFGGTTKPHKIKAKRAKALAFNMGGKNIFAKSVNHPGSKIPARPYLGLSEGDKRNVMEIVESWLEE